MKKGFVTTGLNVMWVDNYGKLTASNHIVYKDEKAVLTAFEKGELVKPTGFAGISIVPVLDVVDVKETPAPKEKPAPKGKAPAAPTGEAKKEGE